MQKMKEKMVASPLWLATAPAATYCLFELLGCWQAYTMFPELQVFQCQNSWQVLVSLLNFNGEGTDWDSIKKGL